MQFCRLKMEKVMALLQGRRSDDLFSVFNFILFRPLIMNTFFKQVVLRSSFLLAHVAFHVLEKSTDKVICVERCVRVLNDLCRSV